jgi:hypothetical protein
VVFTTVGVESPITPKLPFLEGPLRDEYADLPREDCTPTLCLIRRIGPTDPYSPSDVPTLYLSYVYSLETKGQ